MPTLVRIEHLTPRGEWVVDHAGVNLLDPQAYVERIAERRMTRCIGLDDRLQATGHIYEIEGADLL